MATHSSYLVWRIPWTEEPGGLQTIGSQRVDTTQRLHSLTHSLTWDLRSQIRDQTCVPCTGRWILNHWTTREILVFHFKYSRVCMMIPDSGEYTPRVYMLSLQGDMLMLPSLSNLCKSIRSPFINFESPLPSSLIQATVPAVLALDYGHSLSLPSHPFSTLQQGCSI